MKHILIINGSLSGSQGNGQRLVARIQSQIQYETKVIHLTELRSQKTLFKHLTKAHGFIFVTGTYWDSWGSPLQKFLESVTHLEGSEIFLGKPCSIFVLEHSVGGKGVLSRLQGVLSTFGCLIPPMSGMVYSLTADLALRGRASKHKDDFWSLDDIKKVLKNFELSLEIDRPWKSWPVDVKNFRQIWLGRSKV